MSRGTLEIDEASVTLDESVLRIAAEAFTLKVRAGRNAER
jgi:hypothetical protein